MIPQLDTKQVIAELKLTDSLETQQAIQRGKTLVDSVRPKYVGGVFDGTFFVESSDGRHSCHVRDRNDGGFNAICDCKRGRVNSPEDLPKICEHGVAVCFALGYSRTFVEWKSLIDLLPPQPMEEESPQTDPPFAGWERNRRALFAGATAAMRRFPAPVDIDDVKRYYYERFEVKSINDLDEKQMTIAAAEMQASSRDRGIWESHVSQMKAKEI